MRLRRWKAKKARLKEKQTSTDQNKTLDCDFIKAGMLGSWVKYSPVTACLDDSGHRYLARPLLLCFEEKFDADDSGI